jgi:hypothetical protein
MSSPANTEKAESDGAASRRSTRLAIAIPITMSGKDAGGDSFKENTRTIVVNMHGAKITTVHQLSLGSEVEIENRALGLTARAAVVWVGDQRPPRTSFEAGIQLYKAENIWGIQFPPEDWREGAPIGAGGKKTEMPAQPQAAPPPAPPAAPPKSPPTTVAGKTNSAAPPAAKAAPVKATLSQASAAALPAQIAAEFEQMLQRFAQQAGGIASQQTRAFQQSLQSLGQQIGMETESSLRDAAARQEETAEKSRRALEEKVLALESRLQLMRTQVESQTTGLADLREAASEEVEKCRQNLQEAAWQGLESATEELSERIQKELETAAAGFSVEARKRLQQEAASVMESSRSEAEAQLKAQAETLTAAFKENLQSLLQESRQKSTQTASEEVRRVVQEQKEALAGEIREQMEAARQSLRDNLKAGWKDLAGEARRQLMAMAASTAESMNAAATSGLEEFRDQLRKSAKNIQDESNKKREEKLAKLAAEHSADLVARVQSTVSETEEKRLAELQAKANAALQEREQDFERAAAQARTAVENAVKEACETVDKHVGSGALSLKELQEKASAQFDEHSGKIDAATRASAEAFLRQIEGLAGEGLNKFRLDFEALLEQVRKQLEETTTTHQIQVMQEAQGKLTYVTERLTEDSAAQLAALIEDNLEMAQAKLIEASEKVLNDSEDAFRARLAEVIAPALKPNDRRTKPRFNSEPPPDKS